MSWPDEFSERMELAVQKKWAADEKQRLHDRRERIATAVMAGFAAAGDAEIGIQRDAEYAAKWVVRWADALIAELDK